MRKLLSFILTILSLQSCGQNGGLVKADKIKDWKIDEYTIIYSRKLGPAGPHYYEYDIYKRGKYLSYAAYIVENDSCKLLFRERNDYYVTFNLCNNTKTVLSSDKTKLDVSEIDSIIIRPYSAIRLRPTKSYIGPAFDTIITKGFDSTITKRLSDSQIKKFVTRWNSAKVNGYDRLGKGYHYLLTIYSRNSVRRIKSLNAFVTENELWSYETKDDPFFDKVWLDKE
ncbi:MAG TPA: hypothetical protein VIZ28_18425 [Chitinophagaceae bacterium]